MGQCGPPPQQLNLLLVGKCIAVHPEDLNVHDTTDNKFASPNTLRFCVRAYILRIFNGSVHDKDACSQCNRQGEEYLVQGPLAERTEMRLYASKGP